MATNIDDLSREDLIKTIAILADQKDGLSEWLEVKYSDTEIEKAKEIELLAVKCCNYKLENAIIGYNDNWTAPHTIKYYLDKFEFLLEDSTREIGVENTVHIAEVCQQFEDITTGYFVGRSDSEILQELVDRLKKF